MSMNEHDMDSLLGAYALDAVTDDERRAIEAYLAVNPRAAAEVREHREVAAMLAWSSADAPDGVWERIAGSIEAHPAPEPSAELARVINFSERRRRRGATVGAWLIGTAAAALIAVIAVRVSDDNDDTSSASGLERAVAEAMADPNAKQAVLTIDGDPGLKVRAVVDARGNGYLLADSLPALDDNRTYQLWGLVDDELISLGLLGRDPHTAVFNADDEVTLLAITEEQRGGVISSVNPAVVAGELA